MYNDISILSHNILPIYYVGNFSLKRSICQYFFQVFIIFTLEIFVFFQVFTSMQSLETFPCYERGLLHSTSPGCWSWMGRWNNWQYDDDDDDDHCIIGVADVEVERDTRIMFNLVIIQVILINILIIVINILFVVIIIIIIIMIPPHDNEPKVDFNQLPRKCATGPKHWMRVLQNHHLSVARKHVPENDFFDHHPWVFPTDIHKLLVINVMRNQNHHIPVAGEHVSDNGCL